MTSQANQKMQVGGWLKDIFSYFFSAFFSGWAVCQLCFSCQCGSGYVLRSLFYLNRHDIQLFLKWFSCLLLQHCHGYLTENVGIPVWGSYAIFALATLFSGLILGLVSGALERDWLVATVYYTNTFFLSVFDSKTNCSWGTQPTELGDGDKVQNEAPIFQVETSSDLLYHWGIHKSMGPDRIHPRVLRELVELLTKSLSIICQ